MAINFPNSPSNNQIFIDSTSRSQFKYNAAYGVWNRVTGSLNANSISNYYVANGTANSFSLTSAVYNQNNVIVTIDGLMQVPVIQYNISGSTIYFYSSPPQYSIVEIRNFEPSLWGGGIGYTGSMGYVGSAGTSGSTVNVSDTFVSVFLLGL